MTLTEAGKSKMSRQHIGMPNQLSVASIPIANSVPAIGQSFVAHFGSEIMSPIGENIGPDEYGIAADHGSTPYGCESID